MSSQPLINLQLGWPSPRLFARSGLLQGAQEVLSSEEESAAALIYGPHIGHPPLRISLANWLSSVYSLPTGPISHEGIAITNGASGNLANVLQKFTDPHLTRRIFMVEPTYFLACPIFEDNGLQGKLRGVPETLEEGLDIAFLKKQLEEAEAELQGCTAAGVKTGPSYPKIYKYIIYCVSTFANPSGKTLSLQTRKDLVELARQHDALIISDDVYDFLSWPEDASASLERTPRVPPRLVDIDRATPGYTEWGNTLSNGSFSKIIGPGVRVGWADCSPAFARELAEVGASSSGGAPSHLTSTFVDKMLRAESLQAFIREVLVPTYRERYHVMMSSITQRLVPLGVNVEASSQDSGEDVAVAGGFFTYLRLPSDLPAAKTVAAFALKNHQLRIAFGDLFLVAGDPGSLQRAQADDGFSSCVRLCWAWHESDVLDQGVERLADTIRDIRDRRSRGEDLGSDLSIGVR